jgi:hypothetical protein
MVAVDQSVEAGRSAVDRLDQDLPEVLMACQADV